MLSSACTSFARPCNGGQLLVEPASISTIRGNDMSRLGTYFYRLPTVPTSSACSVTISLTIGCVRPLPQPEYPTHKMMGTRHQMMGTGDVQYFPVGTEFSLSREEARLATERAGRKLRSDSAATTQHAELIHPYMPAPLLRQRQPKCCFTFRHDSVRARRTSGHNGTTTAAKLMMASDAPSLAGS